MNKKLQKIKNTGCLRALKKEVAGKRAGDKIRVRICMTGCRAHGAEEVFSAFNAEIKKRRLRTKIEIVPTGCQGLCAMAPVMTIDPQGIFYGRVTPADVPSIVSRTLLKAEPIEDFLYKDPVTHEKTILLKDIPFYKEQNKIVLRNCGIIDPENAFHYIERNGYFAIAKALDSMTCEKVVSEVKVSELRGRGGAGFPTGTKWELASAVKSDIKYFICNGDEGDPGAFMDRAVLEGDPHSVIEGMLIGAYAIGATHGVVYVRAEYPIAVSHMQTAIGQARKMGLLGKNIMGSDFSFDIEIKQGAGAFVCGEETALIASIEGRRGMPRPRPPFPVHSGLWNKPTCINNVETLANIPEIIFKGGKWYSGIGTRNSKGTKVFALAGKVNNTGLVEVPMGMPLKKIVYDIGGGVAQGRTFKAVQMGGPSGGCIPEKHIDLPVDYESIAKVGAIVGSGGLIVADDKTCMVDIARFFMEFIQDESCGKCVPCRIGTKRILEILTRICAGEGSPEDLPVIEELAGVIKDSSLCGLGQTAPNPVLTTMKYFRDEYDAHILSEKRCPAGVCKKLVSYSINPEKCRGCGACVKVCPQGAVSGEKKKPHTIDKKECIKCGICAQKCKFNAIET